MLKTIEATIDEHGHVSLKESVTLDRPTRALVTILEIPAVDDVTLLSEAALSDWNRPEEDEAWAYLQKDQSS